MIKRQRVAHTSSYMFCTCTQMCVGSSVGSVEGMKNKRKRVAHPSRLQECVGSSIGCIGPYSYKTTKRGHMCGDITAIVNSKQKSNDSLELRIARVSLTMSESESTRNEYSQYQLWRQSETLTSWDNAATQWQSTDYRRSPLTTLNKKLSEGIAIYAVQTRHSLDLTLEGTIYLATRPLTYRVSNANVATMGEYMSTHDTR